MCHTRDAVGRVDAEVVITSNLMHSFDRTKCAHMHEDTHAERASVDRFVRVTINYILCVDIRVSKSKMHVKSSTHRRFALYAVFV